MFLCIGLEYATFSWHTQLIMQADKSRLPPAYDVQVICRPGKRLACDLTHAFSLHPDEGNVDTATATRWIIQPDETVKLKARFSPTAPTEIKGRLMMMTQVGGAVSEAIICGCAAYPQVNLDPRRVFSKIKNSPKAGTEICHCYFIQPGYFNFGAVPVSIENWGSKKPSDAPSIHVTTLKIENNGKCAAQVKLDLKSASMEESVPMGKSKKAAQKPSSAFTISPCDRCLNPGEVAQFQLACYPIQPGELQDTIRVSVVGNPHLKGEFLVIALGQ